MDLLQYLKISLLNLSFIMIYIIHKILVFLKNHLNYLKENIYNSLLFIFIFLEKLLFFITYNDEKCET